MGQHKEAQASWLKILDRPDAHPDWYEASCHCLTAMREFDDAQATIDYAWKTYPGHQGIMAMRGHLAVAREDWLHAIAAWEDYTAQYPNDPTGHERLKHAEEALEQEKSQGLQFRLIPPHVPIIEDAAIRSMMLQFESLGDNCEFGIVQRRYGAEPLNLFRWSGSTTETMTEAIRKKFDGVGDPENTLVKSGGLEYYIEDVQFGFITHTWIPETQADKDNLRRKMCKRIAWLKEKLIEDLRSSRKIFVFRTEEVSLEELEIMHDACLEIGPVRLLCVVPESCAMCAWLPLNKPGGVNLIKPSLYIGVLGSLGTWTSEGWDVAYDDWISICRGVLSEQ